MKIFGNYLVMKEVQIKMARHKDTNWNLPEPHVQTWEQANTAVLMDIRDELKRFNNLFHCTNFMKIPGKLEAIRRNTAKKRSHHKKT